MHAVDGLHNFKRCHTMK